MARFGAILGMSVLALGGCVPSGGSSSAAPAPTTTPAPPPPPAPPPQGWSSAPSLAQARYDHTATVLPSGKVLVAGGRSLAATPLNGCELFDPATGLWSATGNLGVARFHHTATLLGNGKVLVVAGHSQHGQISSAELYDETTGTWSSAGRLGDYQWRINHTATLLQSGKVLVTGGVWSTGVFEALSPSTVVNIYGHGTSGSGLVAQYPGNWVYDPSSNSWAAAPALGALREGHSATLLANGQVLVAGGHTDAFAGNPATRTLLSSAELFDPVLNQWNGTTALNAARTAHTATLLQSGRVFVGYGSGVTGAISTGEEYTASLQAWQSVATLTGGRQQHTSTELLDGRLLLAGGSPSTGDLYTPTQQSIAGAGTMAVARIGHTAVRLSGGWILFMGGHNGTGTALASSEYWRP